MQIQVLIKVFGADVPEAVQAVSTVGDQIKAGLQGHSLHIKIRIHCERCGEAMELQGKTLICNSCLADEAAEAALERRMEPSWAQFHIPEPEDRWEAPVY